MSFGPSEAHGHSAGDADVAVVAGAIGHPARAAMLAALLGGRALPAGELARAAGVTPQTASAHLARLVDAGLVVAVRHGRHRYHELAGHEVAEVLEGLAALAPTQAVTGLRAAGRRAAERAGRSCYDHLAGELGVALTDRLCALGALEERSLGVADPAPFAALGVDPAALGAGRRPLTRACLDWTERRPHLAGALGAAVLTRALDAGWVARRPGGRAVAVTPVGAEALRERLGFTPPAGALLRRVPMGAHPSGAHGHSTWLTP